jgi:hypothetical protein
MPGPLDGHAVTVGAGVGVGVFCWLLPVQPAMTTASAISDKTMIVKPRIMCPDITGHGLNLFLSYGNDYRKQAQYHDARLG